MANFCPNCGSALEGAPKFCPSCGSPVAAAAAPAAQPQSPRPAPAAQQPPMQPPQGAMAPPVPGPQPQGAPMQHPGTQPPMNQPPQGINAPQGQSFGQPPQGPGAIMPRPGIGQPGTQPPGQGFGQPGIEGAAFGQSQPGMPQGFQRPGAQGAPVPYGQGGAPFGRPNQPQPFGQPYGAAAFGGGAYVADEGLMAMFFRYDNRLNRKPYLLRSLALFAVSVALSVVAAFVGETFAYLVMLVTTVPAVMLMIRRLHDLDRPAWWAVGAFIPLVNLALSVYLLFFEGTRGPNQYGPDPLEGQH